MRSRQPESLALAVCLHEPPLQRGDLDDDEDGLTLIAARDGSQQWRGACREARQLLSVAPLL